MTKPEALRVVALLVSAYRQDITEETASIWANSIAGYELTDAVAAVQILAESGRFMPSLADLLGIIRECRNDRVASERPRLTAGNGVTFSQYLHDNPDMRERVNALLEDRRSPELGMSPGQAGVAALLRGELQGAKRRG